MLIGRVGHPEVEGAMGRIRGRGLPRSIGSRRSVNIGLTAGASATEILVEDVIEALPGLGRVELTTLPGTAENALFKLPAGLDD